MNFDKLKDCMDYLVNVRKTPGVDCIVYQNHNMIFRYFTGMSDIENNKKINGNELYLIFSMTKMLTCTGALQLYEKGKYSLDDPISKYLPEFEKMKIVQNQSIDSSASAAIATGKKIGESVSSQGDGFAKNPITVKDLFTMGAGLDYNLHPAAVDKAISEGKTSTREIVGALSETVLGFEPGTHFRYSLCHDCLGALIEIWSGESFGEYMRKNVFEPLGMKNTFFGLPKDKERLSRMAALYRYDNQKNPVRIKLECNYNITDDYESGGAGLTSCTEDYALFLDALACGGIGKSGKRILLDETVKLMKTNHLSDLQLEDFHYIRQGYGYGFGVRTHMDESASGSLSPIGEFGWDGAAGAFSLVDTDNNISITYFQHIHGWDSEIQNEIKNAFYGSFLQK